MKICYHPAYNIDLGLLNLLHPFDGRKFKKVYDKVRNQPDIDIVTPEQPVPQTVIDRFVDPLMQRLLRRREPVIQALEIPALPFFTQAFLDKKILTPMRWGAAGTLAAARVAQKDGFCWNLAGGYHHASPHSMEGFCIYNDIGITCQELVAAGELAADDRILIIDTDAHHGNGNARTFMDNPNVHILDVYNTAIYPATPSTRERVDTPVPLEPGTTGAIYLERFRQALTTLPADFRLAFVVAGTDVLASDKLGGLALTLDEVVNREQMTINFLREQGVPAVVLGGGGYSKDSARAIAAAILAILQQPVAAP